MTFQGFRYRFVALQPHKFIVNSLDQPRYAGGIAEVAKALQAAPETAAGETLVEYANRRGDKSLRARLGLSAMVKMSPRMPAPLSIFTRQPRMA